MTQPPLYAALSTQRKEIRLLEVLPPESIDSAEPLQGRLHIACLEDTTLPAYEAVSYCWGEAKSTSKIQLDGQLRDIPASAEEVIRRFRLADQSRLIWIDAVCINLADVVERSSQVALMAEIYSSCSRTIAYLGPKSEHDAAAMDQLKYVLEIVEHEGGEQELLKQENPGPAASNVLVIPREDAIKYFGHVLDLLHRPWFSRLWVVQEFVLAPACRAFMGDFECDGADLFLAARWLLLRTNDQFTDLTRGFETIALRKALAKEPGYSNVMLVMFRTGAYQVSDARDRVYGALGIIDGSVVDKPERKKELAARLQPDYTKTAAQVWQDGMMAMTVAWKNARFLYYVQHNTPEDVLSTEFASWVPRLDQRLENRSSWLPLNFRPDEGMSDMPGYALPAFDQEPGCLTLHGIEADRVVEVFNLNVGSDTWKDRAIVLFLIWHRCGMALARHAISPSSYALGVTLVQGTLAGDRVSPQEFLRPAIQLVSRLIANAGAYPEAYLASVAELPPELDAVFQKYAMALVLSCRYQAFIITDKGDFGLASCAVSVGDTINVIATAAVPYIFRPCPPHTRFVSKVFLYNLMEGQAVRDCIRDGGKLSNFKLI